MRIIGGHDYYDGAAAYGIDSSIVFVRKVKHLTNSDMRAIGNWVSRQIYVSQIREDGDTWNTSQQARQGFIDSKTKVALGYPLVIFCGKLYSGLQVEISEDDPARPLRPKITKLTFWHADKFEAFLAERQWKLGTDHWWKEHGQQTMDDLFGVLDLPEDNIQALIERQIVMARPAEAAEITSYRGTSSQWANARSGWQANGDWLKDVEFQKAVDPVTAFQEISMWVGGTLSAQHGPNVVEITDNEVKLAKHGMDKWSFRRHKDDAK